MKGILMSLVRAWQGLNLMMRILSGIVLGTVLALVLPQLTAVSILGVLFVGALKAIAPVLVAVLVVSSVAKAGAGVGSRFRTVVFLYMFSTLLSAALAVLASAFFPVRVVLGGEYGLEASVPQELADVFSAMAGTFMSNPIQAVADANYLSILMWAIIIGFALKKCASPDTIGMVHEWAEAISEVVQWVIQCAPFGIMGLVFTTVSESGLEAFATYGRLLLLLVGCMLAVVLVLNPCIVAIMLRRNPYPLVFRCLRESAVSAFFTRSSAANIPVNMALCKRMGLDEDFYSVSIPLGSTINMNGAAVTITVMTLATCHTLGVEVSIVSALVLSVIATLGACGTSGVAGGSLLLIPMACALFGIGNDIAMQVVAVGFIIGVVQDSMETALNSSSDVLFSATAEIYETRVKGGGAWQ